MPVLFLVASLIGAAFTLNAYRPSHRWQLLGVSFFAGWLTGELALFHLLWQLAATAGFVWLGALEAWPGWVGLGVSVFSWAGLVGLQLVSLRSLYVIEQALQDGLGDGYADDIAPGMTERLARRVNWRRLALPFDLRDRRVARVKNIEYAPGAGRRHRLDVYRPRAGAEKAPVLLQIHGGAWVIGDKGQQGLPLMLHLAAQGWVCVANNYRLSPRSKFPDHLVDCKLALAWVREHIAEYGGDPDFVVVTGGSAGGHLSALLALTAGDPEYQPGFESVDTTVTACVPFYGVYDLVEIMGYERGPRNGGEQFEKMLMGATVATNREAFERASPITRVHADAPPFFVVHGDADNLVPVTQARRFVERLRTVSKQPVLYAEIPGASHAFEIFHSVRTANSVLGVERFLAWLHSAYQARHPEIPAEPANERANESKAAAS